MKGKRDWCQVEGCECDTWHLIYPVSGDEITRSEDEWLWERVLTSIEDGSTTMSANTYGQLSK